MDFGDTLASFGRGYSLLGAVLISVIAAVAFVIGFKQYWSAENDEQKNKGIMVMGGSVLIASISWGIVYMTQEYKFAAEVEGALGGLNLFQSLAGN